MRKKKVLVGMSGGVDSSVSAALLKEDGYDVSGVFMQIRDERYRNLLSAQSCFVQEETDIKDVKKVAEILGIQLYTVDLSKEFSNTVLDYFVKEYNIGRTPNPCIICNRFLKFGLLADRVRQKMDKEFDLFATGHYVIAGQDIKNRRYFLKQGKDKKKEQSYFLFLLTQKQLSNVLFPLGEYTKDEVRKVASRYVFPINTKKESQDFAKGDISCLFNGEAKAGEITDKDGNILGSHKGIAFYTIGQRKGTGVAKGVPLYVERIDQTQNRIIVGEKRDIYKREFVVENVNWVSVKGIEKEFKAEVKIRYKHNGAPASISPHSHKGEVRVVFDNPQWAITPGQAAVFYKGDILLGGGFIQTVSD